MSEPRSRRSGDVSWIRARLHAAPGATLALAALVLVTAFLAAALPLAVERYEDAALRDTVSHSSLAARSVSMSRPVSWLSAPFDADELVAPPALKEAETDFQHLVRPPLKLDRGQTVYGVRSTDAKATDPGLPRPPSPVPLPPTSTLLAQPDLAANTRLLEGRLPGGEAGPRTVEAVITDRTAEVMKLRPGSDFHLQDKVGSVITVRVTGIVAPRNAGSPWWNAEPDLRKPGLTSMAVPGSDPFVYWHFTALIDEGATDALLDLQDGAVAYWHHPADVDALKARDVPALQDRLAALTSGPDGAQLQAKWRDLRVDPQGLGERLAPYLAERAAARPLVTVAAVGVGAVATVVLLMAAGLSATRRRAEFRLLRARGISVSALTSRLLLESAVTAVPSAAAGLAVAVFLLPADGVATAASAAAAVAVVATIGLPLRVVATVRRPRPEQQREDIVTARPSRRRTVVELTVAVVVAGAVVSLRQRGASDGGTDLLTAAAPVLLAVITALLLMRLYPWPVRLLARPFSRLNGAVLHLGLARAGRAPSTTVLPLLAVLVALAITSFGGSVLAGVDAGRDRAAVTAVGADARVQAFGSLPRGLEAQVRKVSGVREVTGVRSETGQTLGDSRIRFDLLVVEPKSYARLAAATDLGAFPATALDAEVSEPVPVIASPGLARQFGKDARKLDVRASIGPVMVKIVATRKVTPAAPNHEFAIVSKDALAKVAPGSAVRDLGPSTLYVTGAGVDAGSLRAVVAKADSKARVTLRSEQRASYGKTSALQSGAQRVYLAAVAAGAGYSVLALLLSLLHNAPQRKALLARLRTMGMPSRQRQWLAVLEMLPQVLLSALGGILVSLATVPLVRPGVDLAALAFTVRTPATDLSEAVLRTDTASLLLPATALVLLACVVLAVQAWLTGRRGEGTELRMGERS